MGIGVLLRAHRQRRLLSQEQLAERAHVGVRTIRNLESGHTRARLSSLAALADALELDESERQQLLTGQRAPAAQPGTPSGGPPMLAQLGMFSRPAMLTQPAMLPADAADLIGRDSTVRELCAVLRRTDVAPLAMITGQGGIGKTALALRVARQLRPEFPGGQLFIDLRGSGPDPVAPAEALGRFLQAFGIHTKSLPDTVDERADLFRSVTADRRTLIVLDNARDEPYVRQLLPGDSAGAVLVTSRSPLAGLRVTRRVLVEVLATADAVALLAAAAGTVWSVGDVPAARELAQLCAGLPLALQIAGSRLGAEPGLRVADLAQRLAGEHGRLTELAAGDVAVRASLAASYAALDPLAQRALRVLCWFGAAQFPDWLPARLLGASQDQAQRAIAKLVTTHLLELADPGLGGHSRFAFHDLVRLYGSELAQSVDDPGELRAAAERAGSALLAALGRVTAGQPKNSLRLPDLGGARQVRLSGSWLEDAEAEPVAWLAEAGPVVITAAERVADVGLSCLAGSIADALRRSYLWSHYAFDQWGALYTHVLRTVGDGGDTMLRAVLAAGVGDLHLERSRAVQAHDEFTTALRLFRQAGSPEGVVAVRASLAGVCHDLGELVAAIGYLRPAVRWLEARSDRVAAAHAQALIGPIYSEIGDFSAALGYSGKALTAFREAGDVTREASLLMKIGLVYRAQERLDDAFETCSAALELFRAKTDHPRFTAYAALALAKVHLKRGEFAIAQRLADEGRAVCLGLNDGFGTGLSGRILGELSLYRHDFAAARRRLESALAEFTQCDLPLWRARCQRDLAVAQFRSGDTETALHTLRQAEAFFRVSGAREAGELGAWCRRWGWQYGAEPVT